MGKLMHSVCYFCSDELINSEGLISWEEMDWQNKPNYWFSLVSQTDSLTQVTHPVKLILL